MNAHQHADLPNHYRIREAPNGRGFEAIYRNQTRVGTASTEHEARILASNYCFDRAAASRVRYITISPVESIMLSSATRVKAYKATLILSKRGDEKNARSVRVVEDETPVILKGGEYYVCHGQTPLTLRDAYWQSFHTYEVGNCKHLRTVEAVLPQRDGNPKTAILVARCACGRPSRVPNYDFTAAYHCEPDCPAHRTMRERGWRIDRDGDLVDQDDWEVDPASLMKPWTPDLTFEKEPPPPDEDERPHPDAPYAEWKAYHEKRERGQAEKDAVAKQAQEEKYERWKQPYAGDRSSGADDADFEDDDEAS